MSILQLYLINSFIELAQNINVISSILLVFLSFLWVIFFVIELKNYAEGELREHEKFFSDKLCKCKKLFMKLIIYCLLIQIPLAFIPDRKTAIMIYLLPKITNNQSLQNIPDDIHQLILKELKQEDNK